MSTDGLLYNARPVLYGRAYDGFKVLKASGVAVPHTGDTAEFVMATVPIPAGMMGINGALRVTTLWSVTNNSNVKTPRIHLGGVAGTKFLDFQLISVASFCEARLISNRGALNSQIGLAAVSSATAGTTGNVPTTGTIDMSVNQDLVISGQCAVSTDTITLERYIVEVLR